uniref:NB-ARC domain-containing protein n=2 Tax=Setaria italica TaxID=4555 RepID=K3ZNU8_SETIT
MEERFAPVTAATGALGPVLVKLAALLGDEYKLNKKTRRDIMFIKSELEPVHHVLWKLWGSLDLDAACKNWMTEARELSYDMEDDIDDFTLGLERGDGSFIQREATDSPFKEFMERVKDVSKKCGKMQKIGDAICNRSKLTTDPRALFLHKDASELVGMEEKKEEVIQLLQEHEMVCILGFAGMGKTTLADLVYQTIGDGFQCRAFVSVHPSPNMTEILGTILSQVTDGAMSAGSGTEPAAQQNIVTDISISLSDKSSGTELAAVQNDFIKGISNFLSDKRYVVAIPTLLPDSVPKYH